MSLGWIDYTILALSFLFVLAIGFAVRRRVAPSEDFLTSRHSVPVWITSLAFLAANLGAQEVVGMCASGAKYGLMTAHFYWLGAVPAIKRSTKTKSRWSGPVRMCSTPSRT